MTLDQLILRPANISDANQFADIMNKQYLRKKMPEYFKWQFINSPEPTVLICAFEAERICGIFGMKKRMLNNGVSVGQAIDMLIVPEWRGKGLFKKLAEEAVQYFNKQLDMLCVFANPVGSRAVQEALGWHLTGTIKTLAINLGTDIALESEITSKEMDNKPRFHFDKNEGYRNWRIKENPVYSYVSIKDGDSIAWVKTFTDPLKNTKYGDIVDIIVPGNSVLAMCRVIRAACRHLRAEGAELITIWAMPGTLLRGAVKSIGFKEINQERYFCTKVLNPKCKMFTEFSSWELAQVDTEIF